MWYALYMNNIQTEARRKMYDRLQYLMGRLEGYDKGSKSREFVTDSIRDIQADCETILTMIRQG